MLKVIGKSFKRLFLFTLVIIGVGLLIPQNFTMPVEGASKSSYNHESFWYYPWGKSVTHKGVDIFASAGKLVKSSTSGIVLYTGHNKMGGNIALILGPKWRIHYYAHLKEISTSTFSLVSSNEVIGSVGNTGNAMGRPAHLHYSIVTLIPYVWRIDNSKQGWKKMFYLNPIKYLNASQAFKIFSP